MKKTLLRLLLFAVLLSLISAIAVSIIGLMVGWKTSTQFSDGLFWAGVVMILIGFISFQGYKYRAPNWPPVRFESVDSTKLWVADTIRGKTILAAFGMSGLLLFGLSILVSKIS